MAVWYHITEHCHCPLSHDSYEDRRLSGSGWIITYRQYAANGDHVSTNRAWCRATWLQQLTVILRGQDTIMSMLHHLRCYCHINHDVPSVLPHCRLEEHPASKRLNDGVLLVSLSVCSEVQMICKWSGWCHCRPSSLASLKSRMV